MTVTFSVVLHEHPMVERAVTNGAVTLPVNVRDPTVAVTSLDAALSAPHAFLARTRM